MDLELWKKRRKELGLRYEDLAEKSGVSKRSIEDIFRGYTTSPRIDTVEAIERALGINEKSPPATQEGVKIPDALKPYQYAFFEGMEGLSEESIKDILKYIEFRKAQESGDKK